MDPSFFAVLSIAAALAAVLLLLLTGRSKAFALEIPSGYGLSIDQLCAESSGITLQSGQTYLVAGPEGFVTLARVSQTDSLDGYTFNIATRGEIELSVTYDENQKVVLSKSFFGIGNAQHPFRGTISMLGATDDTALKMTDWKVLFNNLSSKGSVQSDAAGKKLVAQEDGAFSLCDTITIEPDSAVLNISGFSFARKTTDSSGETTVSKGVVHTDRSAGLVAARVTGSGSCWLDLTRSFVSGEQYELNTTSGDGAGLFAAIDSDAAIAVTLPANIDLTVSTASGHAGLLAGENKGTLTVNGDVALHGSATASGDDFAAGLVGCNKKVAEFTGSVNVSAITASGDYAGGIVGRNEAGASVTFASDASLTAVNATGRIIGGVAGLSQGIITAAGTCTVSGGTFTAQGSAPVMGGFIGSTQNATLRITGSTTAASIRHENGSYNINEVYLGGMVGKSTTTRKVDLTNNIISAVVIQEQSRPNAYVGGCIAILECSNYVDVDLTGTSATAEASVSAKSTTAAGGLIGHTFDKCRLVLDGVWQGTVNSGSGSVGGLLYKLNGKLTANEHFSVDGAEFTSGGAFKGAILGDGITAFVVIGCAPENMKNIPANFDLFAGRNISASTSIGVAANGGLVTVETSGAQIGQIPSSGGWPELMNAHSNALTRYYFNIARLDQTHGDKHTPSTTVSSPADLIYWNVYDYIQGWDASTKTGGLPDYVKAESFPTEIQNITGATKDVDLTGYSFYPTKKEAVSFDFSGRTLTFGRTVSLTGGSSGAKTVITMPGRTDIDKVGYGFINAANGCGVYGLEFQYGDLSLSSSSYTSATSRAFAAAAKTEVSHFGGIISWVIGGDNVLDNVSVTVGQVTPGHKTSVFGGYVGLVTGGGVTVRDLPDTGVNADDFAAYYYYNPYVGKVLSGYVLSDDAGADKAYQNTDKNFSIPHIMKTAAQTAFSGNTITLADSDDLFMLSFGVSGGALGYDAKQISYGQGALSRHGDYSKVGTENLSQVKTDGDLRSGRYEDDLSGGGNSIFNAYFGVAAGRNLKGEKLTLNLTGENYDMRAYPNAFRGLGSPYSGGDCFTFAVVKGRKDTSNAPLSTVTLAVDLKQYYVSGAYEQDSVYNLAFVIENSGNSSKITYNGLKVSGNLSLSVMDAATGREIETKNRDKPLFCLAGFVGYAANAEFTDVAVENLSVHSPGWAAGLVASEKDNTNNSAVKNCKITGLTLLGRQSTGAVYGFLRVQTATKLSGVSVSDSSIRTRNSQIVNTSYQNYNASAGGLVGAIVVYDNNNRNGKIEISDSVIARSSIVFETSALYSGSSNGHAGGFIGSSANSASFTNCTLDSTVVLSTGKWNDAGKYPTEYTASSVEMAGVSAPGVKNAMAYALSSTTGGASGNAGGFLGVAAKTNTFTACKITSDTSATVILGYQNGGGMVGNGPDGAAYTFTDVTIQATNSPLCILGRACAAGLLPWDKGRNPITANHVKVAGSGDSALLYILSNKNQRAWASGFFGNFGNGGNAVTMTDAELTGCVIAAMEVAGIASRCSSTSATFSNIRISGNYLQVIGRDSAAGAVSKVQNTTTIDGLYLADNTIRQAKNAGNAGALAAIVDSDKILNGYDILMKGNDVGYSGSLKPFPQILSASGMLELKGTSGESQDKAGLVAYRNSGTVNILALSSEDDQYPSIVTGNKGRIVFAGYGTPSLYEKKYAQNPAYTPKQALADHGVTPDGLAEILNGDPLTSQGAVFTPDYLNEKLRSGASKTWSDKTLSQDSTELYKLSYFAPGIAKNADLPVFHITGRTNLTVSGLLNLITNGGYGSMSGAFQVQSLQADRYTLNSDGTLTLAENGTGDGSVRYENGRFTAGKYDDLRSDHKTLTVLTLTLADTAGAHTYSMNLVAYYPQILQYKSNISPLEGEQYQLSPFLNNSSYTMSGQDKRFHLDINAGSKFTFYMEYAYNDVAENIEGYNFGKYVFSHTLDSETQEGGKFAVGTKFVLVDLNSLTASGYKSYYGQVKGQSTAQIDLSSFRRGEDVAFQEKLLEEIVGLTPGRRLNTDQEKYPYVERYLMAVIPPETDTEQKQFNLCAKVKDNDRNIIVKRDEEYCAISVWAPPTGNIAFSSTSQTFSNTADTALKTDVSISEIFRPEYIAAMKGRALYGTHVFTIVDSSGAAVQFPAGTVVRLTAADGTVLQTTTVMQSTSSVKYSVGDTISKVDSQYVYSDSFTISFDFSAASPLEFGRSFPKDAKFTVQDQFYLSGDEEHYSDGARVSDSTNSITAAEVSPVKLAIVPKDRKRLAINFGDLHETTDDGKITFDLTADFSAVLAQGVENSRASVDFSVVKKTYDEAAGKHVYTGKDLLSAADPFVSVSTADAPVSGSSALTIDADGTARGAYELAVDLSAVERLLQTSGEDQPYDPLTNYRLVANVTLTGTDASTGETVHYTASGYFVFLLCNIHSGVA